MLTARGPASAAHLSIAVLSTRSTWVPQLVLTEGCGAVRKDGYVREYRDDTLTKLFKQFHSLARRAYMHHRVRPCAGCFR